MCQEAVTEYPESSTFWYNLGVVMQRCEEESGFTPQDYLRCFENAVKWDRTSAEAYQELAYILDTYFDDFEKSERAFEKAIELGAGHKSYNGRARVLAQMGRVSEAIDSLSKRECPFHDHPEVDDMRSEILSGIWFRTGS